MQFVHIFINIHIIHQFHGVEIFQQYATRTSKNQVEMSHILL